MTETWTVTARRIEQHHLPGMYLGRNVFHDSRNLSYPWRHSGAAPASTMWTRHGGILDQGDLGSCTGNAELPGPDLRVPALPVPGRRARRAPAAPGLRRPQLV
jgi:hypothetical protein